MPTSSAPVDNSAIVSLLNEGATISKLTVSSTPGATVTLFDSPNNEITYSQPEHKTVTTTVGDVTKTYTNILNREETDTFPAITTAETTVPAATVDRRTIASLTVPANGTSVLPSSAVANLGVAAKSTAAANVTINYVEHI